MSETYEEVLSYSIYRAIELRAKELQRKLGFDDLYTNSLVDIPHNSLLTDKDWVYENVEYLFVYCMFNYQKFQGSEEYYLLFKTLIEKYNIEEDYNELLCDCKCFGMELKWGRFAHLLVEFFAHAFDQHDVLDELFCKSDFVNYFFKYPKIYTHKVLEDFGYFGIGKLLNYEAFASYYLEQPDQLIRLMRNHPKLDVPIHLFSDERFLKIAHDINVENFYFNMGFVWENSSGIACLEEHQKFCDYEMTHTNHGILPSLMSEYESSLNILTEDSFCLDDNPLKKQVVQRIFDCSSEKSIPKNRFYQELSKYIAIGLLISRYFETSPYNLLIDIQTLYEFAIRNHRKLEGNLIYDFLLHFENFDIFYIIKFYQKIKDLSLKDILYDDWERQKNKFVEEINSSIFSPKFLVSENDDYGVPYYDISNLEDPILVHNTGIAIDDVDQINQLIYRIKNVEGYMLCFSLQDLQNQIFYEKNKKHTIKFIYGTLDPMRVGIVNHEDAYSQGLMKVEYNNRCYKRRLYTLEEFMMLTNNYNEIVYSTNNQLTLPIGILCEESPTGEEIRVAEELGISIFYRTRKNPEKIPSSNRKQLIQRYEWRIMDMNLFPKEK